MVPWYMIENGSLLVPSFMLPPVTSKKAEGVCVPMATLPVDIILRRSVLFVRKERSFAFVVPIKFVLAFMPLLPVVDQAAPEMSTLFPPLDKLRVFPAIERTCGGTLMVFVGYTPVTEALPVPVIVGVTALIV